MRFHASTLIALVLMGLFLTSYYIRLANASGTIYIRADGSVDPPTAPILRVGDTYKLIEDIFNNSIVVERNGITLDGNGHRLQAFRGFPVYNNYGVYLYQRNMVTVTNFVISDFLNGIWLEYSTSIKIVNNIIFRILDYGIRILRSDYNLLMGNTVNQTNQAIAFEYSSHNSLYNNKAKESRDGISIYMGTNNTLKNNVMVANDENFFVGYFYLEPYINDVDTSNTVDGKPICYWINRHHETIPPDAGVMYIVNSSWITIRNLNLRNNWGAVTLAYTHDSLIENVTATYGGIVLDYSDSNIITGNSITDVDGPGISLDVSNYNDITNNFVSNTTSSGIWLEDTRYNTVTGNKVTNSSYGTPQEFDGAGVLVDDSQFCQVSGNTLTGNYYGIVVGADAAQGNLITGNDVIMNGIGLVIAARYNMIYHNNFIENKQSAHSAYGGVDNFLDNGYPSGGNYWSDYTGWDANNDGIGDSPYVSEGNNQDRYPLMSPYGKPPLPKYTLTITTPSNGSTNPPPGSYRHSQGQKIPVKATPSTGYVFDHWELDSVSIGVPNPVDITMNSNHSLRAVFAVPTHGVSLKAHCNAEGAEVSVSITMDGSPTGYDTPKTFTIPMGNHTFKVPTADSNGHLFKQWSTGQTSTTITVSSSGTYTAYYDVKHSLTVTSNDEGTTNPAAGTYTCWAGTEASVSAFPDAGCYLDSWILDGLNIGIPSPVNVTMNANHTLQAVFKQLSPGPDVAIKWIASKTIVGQGYTSTIKVTALNVGSYTETFNVTIYVNATPVASQAVTLESAASAVITCMWNTAGFAKGNYNITAVADTVPGETETADNTFIGGRVTVAMIGDITGPNGWPDGKLDIKDISIVARYFGRTVPPAPSNCDITGPVTGVPDNKIDIRDISIVARHFGELDP